MIILPTLSLSVAATLAATAAVSVSVSLTLTMAVALTAAITPPLPFPCHSAVVTYAVAVFIDKAGAFLLSTGFEIITDPVFIRIHKLSGYRIGCFICRF